MNTNALRQKILDFAIHGKLVKQDPADEPASVMLEKLRAEKEAKIAAGEIKRGKNDSYIFKYTGTSGKSKTDDNPEGLEHNRHYEKFADGRVKDIEDEIPFAVPEGWAWCRLPNLCKIPITDGTHQTPTYSDKENGIPFLSSKDVTSRKIDWNKIKYITKELHEELQKRIQPCRNDILLAKNGTTGVAALVDTDKIFDIYVTLAVLRPAEVVHPNYLHYVINSPFCKKQFNGHLTGIGVPNLHLNDICKTIIPLPPLSEQQRIVAKIETIFAQIDLLEQNKADLQTAVKQAKSKILDLAIHGKLVPQDPADEPASVMLEKLRAEKETKIAAGEIKRGKHDSYIYKNSTDNCYYQKYTDGCEENISDEIPFDVPAGWAWCRLGEILDFKGGGTPDTSNPSYWNGSLNWASVKDIKGDFLYSTADKITELGLKNSSAYLAKIDDIILITRIVPGKAIITKIETAINQDLKILLPTIEIDKHFLLYFFRQNEDDFVEKSSGTTVKGIKLEYITSKFLPLPPLSEQHRIVAKIEELFTHLDFLMTALIA